MKITLEAENDAELAQMKGQMKAERIVFEGMGNLAIIGTKTLIGTDKVTKQQTPIGIQPVQFTWMNGAEGAGLLIGFLETAKIVCQEIRLLAAQAPKTPLIVPGSRMVDGMPPLRIN